MTGYLVPAVGQVDPEHSHAMQDKLHGGQQVIQHSRLQKINKLAAKGLNFNVATRRWEKKRCGYRKIINIK